MDLIEMQKEYLKKGELVNRGVVDTDKEYEFLDALVEWDIKVIPQFKIDKYRYDFKIVDYPIIIEIDGKIHEQLREKDYKKDRLALMEGYTVIRYSNDEISKVEYVDEIKKIIGLKKEKYKVSRLEHLRYKINNIKRKLRR